jgi:hypothetical protein
MEYGIVRSNRFMWWAAEKERLYFSRKFEDAFRLGHGLFKDLLFGSKVDGYCCRDCKLIIIDYSHDIK